MKWLICSPKNEYIQDMKKILMITYYFPPLSNVGGLRVNGFSRYLPDYGWEPYVLTVKNPDMTLCTPGDETHDEKVRVIRAKSLFNLNWCVQKSHALLSRVARLFGKEVKRNIFHEIICIPDAFIGWIIPCFIASLRIIRKHEIDVLFVTSKPFSSVIPALLVKKITRKPLVIDFRDPTNIALYEKVSARQGDIIERFRWSIIQWIERKALSSVDLFIVTTDETKKFYQDLYPFLKDKTFRIYNGFSQENVEGEESIEGFEKFTITYSGNVYHTRISPTPFFRALHNIFKDGLIPGNKFRFLYVGEIRGDNNWLKKLSEEFELNGVIEKTGRVSREESFEIMRKSSLLLLRIIPRMISTKLYEGLAAGVPILATINEGEVEDIIHDYSHNSYVITTESENDIVDAIIDAYEKWEKGKGDNKPNHLFLESFNKKHLTGEFIKLLEKYTQPFN